MLQGIDLEELLTNLDRTLAHFHVPDEKRSGTGDFLIRFAIMYSEQQVGTRFTVPADDPHLNYLMDLWEYFNRL